MITRLPPSMMRVKTVPSSTTSGVAPMMRRMSGAKITPTMLMITVTNKAIIKTCIPACAAAAGSFSPILLATIAVAAMLKPIASE